MQLHIMLLGTAVGGTYLTSTIIWDMTKKKQKLAKRKDSKNLGISHGTHMRKRRLKNASKSIYLLQMQSLGQNWKQL